MAPANGGGGFMGGLGQPGVRISERTGSTQSEIGHPLIQGAVLMGLVALAGLTIAALMALIGRGLLLAAVLSALGYVLWRAWWAAQTLLWQLAVIAGGALAVWAWLTYGQGYAETLWWPVWYGVPVDGYLPVNFTPQPDPLAWRLWPGWIVPARLLLTATLAIGYPVVAYLLTQRFALAILFPQLDAFTPKPVELQPRLPRFIRTVQDTNAPAPVEQQAIYVTAVDLADHERMVGDSVAISNGSGNSLTHTNVGILTLQQWDALAHHLDGGGKWSNRALAPRLMTNDKQRELTALMLRASLLEVTGGGQGEKPAGYALTNAGRAFFREHVYAEHLAS